MINENLHEKFNTLIQETVIEKKKKETEEDPNFLFNNNANNKSFSIEVLCLTYMFC